MYICVYIYVCICVYIYIYIHMCIYREIEPYILSTSLPPNLSNHEQMSCFFCGAYLVLGLGGRIARESTRIIYPVDLPRMPVESVKVLIFWLLLKTVMSSWW